MNETLKKVQEFVESLEQDCNDSMLVTVFNPSDESYGGLENGSCLYSENSKDCYNKIDCSDSNNGYNCSNPETCDGANNAASCISAGNERNSSASCPHSLIGFPGLSF